MPNANSSTGTAHVVQTAKVGDYVLGHSHEGTVLEVYPDGSVRIVLVNTRKQVVLESYEVLE